MELRITIEQPKLLVVEGTRDKEFFEAFIKHLGLQDIQVHSIRGKGNMRADLRALVSRKAEFSRVSAIGIIRDADDDANAAFQSVYHALRELDLPSPEQPFCIVGDKPRVGVVILPSSNETGALEDVCLKAVQKDPATSCVEQYFTCLHKKGVLSVEGRRLAKAKVQVFLASKADLPLNLGIAAQKGYWPWSEEPLRRLGGFLCQLYKDGE